MHFKIIWKIARTPVSQLHDLIANQDCIFGNKDQILFNYIEETEVLSTLSNARKCILHIENV